MRRYWHWLSASTLTPGKRGRNCHAIPKTHPLEIELLLLQRELWFAEYTIQTSPYRRIADSFGLRISPPSFLASLS
jgi:hypothetical protein